MGSDSDNAGPAGAPDGAGCEPCGIEKIVGLVSEKMCCSLPQARLSIDAVIAAIKEAPKPLRIAGFGIFEADRFRRFK